MNQRIRVKILPFAIASLLAMGSAMAQNTSSSMTGRVVDSAGKPVAGATVQIVHVPSGTTRIVTTDASGQFNAQGLRVGGPFDVIASKAGLEKTEKDDVYLKLSETATVDLSMGVVAKQLAEVKVTGSVLAQTFQPDNKGLSTNISSRELKVIPDPGRSIQDIARLDPMINITNKERGEISALGQNSRYNNITIDAVPTNDSFGLEANGLPSLNQPISVDTIEEYNISTANYDVTSKRAVGASINAVTKSGTNDFHGSIYYYYNNAKDMVGKGINDTTFPGYTSRWTGGFTIGGPIIKDKLFFFANYEDSKLLAPAPSFGPIGSGKSNIVGVTQAQLDQVTQIARNYGMTPGDLNASSANQDEKKYLAKIDWNINNDHRASFRYDRTKSTQPILGGFSTRALSLSSYWYTQKRDLSSYVLNLYDDWSDRFSTEASFSYGKYSATPTVLAKQPQVTVNVTPSAAVNLGEEQFRHYNVLNVGTYTGFFAGTWFLGDHTIKAGADFQRDNFYNLFGRTEFGAYTFSSIAAFQSGSYTTYNLYQPANGNINSIAANWRLDQWGFFVQDTWQIGNLSLQYGLRWDVPKTPDRPLNNPGFAQTFGMSNQGTVDGHSVLEPRLSFNYAFDTALMTQLRGGIGIMEGVSPGVWLSNPFTNNGLTINSYFARNSGPGAFNPNPYTQQPPGAAGAQQTVDVVDPHFQLPTVLKWSLALDRELPWWGTVFTAEWEHIGTLQAIQYENLNLGAPSGAMPDGRESFWSSLNPALFTNPTRPTARQIVNANPAFGGVTLLTNSRKGHADYVTLQVKKPFTPEWFGSVGLVVGRATDVNSGTSSQASSNWSSRAVYNPNENVAARSNYDISRRVIASLTWQHKFFGDYTTSVSAFYDGHTGQPYSWVFGNDANGDRVIGNDLVYIPRPGDVLFTSNTTAQQIQQFYDYIKADSYLSSHQGQVARRNGVNSPWVNEVDLSFRQEIPGLFKGNKGEIRFDVYNFTNLLNKKWGQVQDIGYPFNRDLAYFAGVDPATGKYVYALPTSGGNYRPETYTLEDRTAQSRWALYVTLRYTF